MRKDVVKFAQECPICQKSRLTSKEATIEEYHVTEAYEPFEEISMDYMVGLAKDKNGDENILVVVDNFTKYVELFPLVNIDAESTARCLVQLFARYGHISRIRSDRGPSFIGDVCRYFLESCGTDQILTYMVVRMYNVSQNLSGFRCIAF